MKRKIFGILFAAVVVVSLMMVPAASVGANPGPGLVGLWHFDEGSGSTAADSSVYVNDGTLSGGKFGNALDFDGSDDGVYVADSPSLDFSMAITIEAWIYLRSYTNPRGHSVQTVAEKAHAYYLNIQSGQLSFYWYGLSNPGYHKSTNTLPLNTWIHVAATYDGSAVKLYENGVNVYSVGVTGTGQASNWHLGIGYEPYEPTKFPRYFYGIIDEVRISDTVRYPAGFTPPTAPFLSDTNTVGLWHFDESVGSTADDETANGNDGTIHGASWAGPTWATGMFDDALSFDGSDDYVQLPASNTILDTDTFTVEAWFKTSLNHPVYGGTEGRIVNLHWKDTASTAVSLYVEKDKIGLLYHKGSMQHVWVTYNVNYYNNVWHHIAVTYDATTYKLYYEGTEVKSQDDAFGGFGTFPAYLGTYNSCERFFNGEIDEVRIWDRALSSSEIAALAGKPLALDHFLGYKVKTTKVCDGGVTELTLLNNGPAGEITVTAKDGVVFEPQYVENGASFSFGEEGVKLGTSITITVDGGPETPIHTSCSQPIYQGLTFGDFTVVEGESLKGGPLETAEPKFEPKEVTLTGQFATGLFKVEKPDKLYNPADKNGEGINDPNTHLMSYKVKLVEYLETPTCAPCKGGLTSLTLQNDGPDANITVTTKDEELFNDTVASGGQFKVSGTGKDGKLDKDVTITVDGVLQTTIHTSCSQPIGTGQTFGDFTVVDGESKDGGQICPIITVESQFGTIVVARDKPDRLLVPTAKSLTGPVDPLELELTGVDHFLGYKIKAPKDMAEFEVMLVDQFKQPKWYVVKKPTRLFVPVDKGGEVIKNPEAHLICYTIKPVKDEPKHINVLGIYTNNQFGRLKLNTDKEVELLVPCTKILQD